MWCRCVVQIYAVQVCIAGVQCTCVSVYSANVQGRCIVQMCSVDVQCRYVLCSAVMCSTSGWCRCVQCWYVQCRCIVQVCEQYRCVLQVHSAGVSEQSRCVVKVCVVPFCGAGVVWVCVVQVCNALHIPALLSCATHLLYTHIHVHQTHLYYTPALHRSSLYTCSTHTHLHYLCTGTCTIHTFTIHLNYTFALCTPALPISALCT